KIPSAAPERPPRDDLRVVIGHHDHLLRARQVDPGDRIRHRHQGAQPLQPSIAVAVTSGYATTVTHERPPAAWDTKPETHQGDVPTSPTDTQNVFLCRGRRTAPGLAILPMSEPLPTPTQETCYDPCRQAR